MKHPIQLAIVFFAASVANLANADEALAKKHACTACHDIADRIVGPSFQEVASKRASEKDAEAKLVTSILKGGSGQYGKIPMPEQSHVSEPDAKALAKWVLSLGAK